MELLIRLPKPHPKQFEFIRSPAKRKIIRAGRRGGKTVGMAILAVERFLQERRVLYATPTADQIQRFWYEVTGALAEPIQAGILAKNETLHTIEIPGTLKRIRAKTAWNAETLRGDYADDLILDEYQLMCEDAWEIVGAPMLADNNGDAAFIYTPPSIRTAGMSKARDKRHAAKLFKEAQADTSGRWQAFHFTSHDNPHISEQGLAEIARDMSRLAYEQEILAMDREYVPGALWTPEELDALRWKGATPPQHLTRIVVGVDPEATSGENSSETGIIVAAKGEDGHGYVLDDVTLRATPHVWASAAVTAYHTHRANLIVYETNQGGEMVEHTLKTVDERVPLKGVHASKSKVARAEPIAALYEQGKVHHVGMLGELEDQLCNWLPGDKSPDRLDAMVWALTELMLGDTGTTFSMSSR